MNHSVPAQRVFTQSSSDAWGETLPARAEERQSSPWLDDALADAIGIDRVGRTPASDEFTAAAILAQPFVLYAIALRFGGAAPTTSQWSHVDPILKLLPPEPTLWLVPAFGVALTIAWGALSWPSWRVFGKSLLAALFGAALVGGAAALWLHQRGNHVPPGLGLEENVGQGLCLGVTAGYLEETLLRLVVLPLFYLHMNDRPKWLAVIVASLVTGLAFAGLHEQGTAVFEPTVFLVRFLVPGFALSVLALLTRPAFVVGAHLSAHVVLALLFV